MVDQPLVKPEDLVGFPGAPFPPAVVNAAAGAVRGEAEWHIAPEVTETATVETGGARVALLRSLRVVEVTEVRDADTGTVLDGWRVNEHTGVLTRKRGTWPTVIEVDMRHGYEKCPDELLPVIAERAQRTKAGIVSQENIGARSVSLRQNYDPTSAMVLARYMLPPRP